MRSDVALVFLFYSRVKQIDKKIVFLQAMFINQERDGRAASVSHVFTALILTLPPTSFNFLSLLSLEGYIGWNWL